MMSSDDPYEYRMFVGDYVFDPEAYAAASEWHFCYRCGEAMGKEPGYCPRCTQFCDWSDYPDHWYPDEYDWAIEPRDVPEDFGVPSLNEEGELISDPRMIAFTEYLRQGVFCPQCGRDMKTVKSRGEWRWVCVECRYIIDGGEHYSTGNLSPWTPQDFGFSRPEPA